MKSILTITLALFTGFVFSQGNQVLNSFNYLKSKEYDKAKASTDAAAENESTKGSAKMWMYRGNVYRAIYEDKEEKVRSLDAEAEEKALEAYMNCLAIDLKENAKSPVYKDEVKGSIVVSAAATNRKAGWYGQAKDYEKALKCYGLVENALIYDFDQGMKRANITKEKLLYNKYEMYGRAGDIVKAQEFADKLITINYKEPKIYINMAGMLLGAKDTVKALAYIEKGKALFEDNATLIDMELFIYEAQKKLDKLKTKLTDAIALSPDNEILHASLANVYDKGKEYDKAEAEYLKALEIKPDFEAANYNLGVIYYNLGGEWAKKAGDLPPKEAAKAKEYDAKANDNFKKAVIYLEKSFTGPPDGRTKQQLRRVLLRLGETEKADKYK